MSPAPGPPEFGSFDFSLDADGEARAARLHAEAVIIDLMYHGPLGRRHFSLDLVRRLQDSYDGHRNVGRLMGEARQWGSELAADGQLPDFEASFRASGLTVGHFPFEINSAANLVASAALLTRLVDDLPWLTKIRTVKDVIAAKESGGLGYLGMCQPYEPISRDLSLVRRAHDLGLRSLMLTYNNQDLVGSGCTERTDSGVSNFGREVISLCNDLGIMVDTAHCGRRTTLDACELSRTPVIASHTCAAAVYPHDRAKSDEELRAIAGSGGVIGVVTLPFFLGEMDSVSMLTWLDHCEYIANLVGWQHVAIGTDWPLPAPKWAMERWIEGTAKVGFRPEHGTQHGLRTLPGFDDYRDLPNLTRGLVSRGATDDQVLAVLGGNALRVMAQVL